MAQINRGSSPLYKQIAEYIREKIEHGEWEVGYKIPTEHKLMEKFKVSRITVVKALDRLVEESYLIREQGKGSYVKSRSLLYESSELLSFSESMKKSGKTSRALVLEKKLIKPSVKLIDLLKLNTSDLVWMFKRLMLADNEPVGVQTSYLSQEKFPDLGDKIIDDVSLYNILETEFNTYIEEALETYSSVQLDEEENSLLEVKGNLSGFSVERLSFYQNQPVEFVRSIMRSDKTSFTVKVKRK